MQLLREVLFLLLAFLDLEFTKRRIHEMGPEIEMNPAIRKLISWFGVDWGTTLGVLIPTSGLAVAGWFLPNFLSYLLGVRSFLFALQVKSVEL